MADEVQINNVGGDGVASEVTLANLLAVTEQMAKKAGVDPKDVTKKLTALSKASESGVKVTTKSSDALKKNTKAVKDSTSAFKKIGGALGGALLSSITSITRAGTEMTKAFIAGETSMTAFASQVPLIGNQISILTGLFDDSFRTFQNVAGSGAAFNNSLTDLRNSAAGARMPLDEFASMVSANSDKLASFGGTATQGAQQIVALNRALGGNRNDLLNMGLSFQEINEALIDFQYLQRAGNRGRRLDAAQQREQAEAAADYTKNLVTLGKLTGEDVKSQQEKIAQAQMDVAMQAQLATMSVEERRKMDQLMADTLASGGQAAVDALKREFLGMPPMTEEAALYTSQFGENMNSIRARLEDVYDGNVTAADMASSSTEYMAAMINGNAEAFARLQPGITAAAAGLDGPMATLADQLMGAGVQFTDFIDETGRVDQERLREALESARRESDARDETTDSVATFMETITSMQSAFQTSIINPLMDAVAPALNSLVDALRGPVDEEGEPIGESGFATAIATVSDYINNKLAPGILEFIDAFKDDPMGTIKEYFSAAISGLGDMIADFFLGENTRVIKGASRGGGDVTVEQERSGGFLQEAIMPMITAAGDALVNGLKEGIKYIWEETSIIETMVGGIAALWAGKALASAMLTGVGNLMRAGVSRMRGSAPITPGATPPATPDGPDRNRGGGRLGRAARFLGRGAKFIPGVGLIAAGAMGAFDAASGFSADPNAGLGESLANAGSSALNGLTFGLLGSSPDEIAANATANETTSSEGATSLSTAELATVNNPTLQENIDALKSLDASSVTSYTEAVEGLVEALNRLNEELSQDNDTMFTSRADAGELLSGISTSTSGTSQGTQQLNNTMQQVLVLLREMRDLDIDVERNTRNIIGSNLAQGGVSNVAR